MQFLRLITIYAILVLVYTIPEIHSYELTLVKDHKLNSCVFSSELLNDKNVECMNTSSSKSSSFSSTILPDYWNAQGFIDIRFRIQTNGESQPEQLVKVTDRKHRHPVFATICSLAFLITIISIVVVCTQ